MSSVNLDPGESCYAMAAVVSAQLSRDVDLAEITVENERAKRFEIATKFLSQSRP